MVDLTPYHINLPRGGKGMGRGDRCNGRESGRNRT